MFILLMDVEVLLFPKSHKAFPTISQIHVRETPETVLVLFFCADLRFGELQKNHW